MGRTQASTRRARKRLTACPGSPHPLDGRVNFPVAAHFRHTRRRRASLSGPHPCESDACARRSRSRRQLSSGCSPPSSSCRPRHAAGPTNGRSSAAPAASGVADDSVLPRTLVRPPTTWPGSIDVPGRGWSSPIVWHDRVFVTSAVSPGAFKAPSTGIFGNDYAAELAEAGPVRRRDPEAGRRPRHRADRPRAGDDQLHGLCARREDRQGDLAAGSAPRRARSADATARTPTRPRRPSPTASGSTPRSAATSASSATRSTASCCGSTPGRRSRSISTSAPRRRRWSTAAASISCTTTTASRSSPRSTRRPARSCGS